MRTRFGKGLGLTVVASMVIVLEQVMDESQLEVIDQALDTVYLP